MVRAKIIEDDLDCLVACLDSIKYSQTFDKDNNIQVWPRVPRPVPTSFIHTFPFTEDGIIQAFRLAAHLPAHG